MINTTTTSTNNIFGLFPEYNLEQSSAVKTVSTETKPIEKDTVELTKGEKKSRKRKIIFGSTLASTIIAAGVTGLLLIRGNKGSVKKLTEMGDKLAKEIQEASNLQTKDLMTRFNIVCKKGMKKTVDFLQATSNTNAIKDGAVDSALRSNRVTRPFAEKTKGMFKKIVDKTLGKKYTKIKVDVDDITATIKHYKIADLRNLDDAQKMQQVTIKGVTKTLGEWTDDLAKHVKNLSTAYDEGFGRDAIVGRNRKRSGLLSGLADKVKARFFKNKGILKVENYRTYATEELAKPAQDELSRSIIGARKKVTNNIDAIHESIRNSLNAFSENAKADDDIAVGLIKKLSPKIDAFKSCSGASEAIKRAEISDDIAGIIDDAVKGITQSGKYSKERQVTLIDQLLSIKESALSTKGSSKGALEEITSILKGLNETKLGETGKKIVTDSELKHITRQSSKIRDKLRKASELEMGEYFLKQAELEVGSAANDVISVLLPVGVGAYSIAKGDDKDEKVSAVLTTCIPLVGTFATFVYGTAKMFSGAKNLIFSAVSGLVLGKLGNYCDKLYKDYKKSGSVTQVAKEEVDKFWTDITPKYAEPLKNGKEVTVIEQTKAKK